MRGAPSKNDTFNNTIVTITDRGFLIAVYLLLLSIKYFRVRARIHILCVNLPAKDKEYLRQFAGVKLFDADPANTMNPCTRKAEAILTAEGNGSEYITLLDGDDVLTGDITPYLSPGVGLSTRIKTPQEDAALFARSYVPGEIPGFVAQSVLDVWKRDVAERETPRITYTVAGGNLTIHRQWLDFVRKWHAQMMKVLPHVDPRCSHDHQSHAYFQTDESVLVSLLAFAHEAPAILPGLFDQDPKTYVAHLGPEPKPWVLLPVSKLRYFTLIANLFEWAKSQGYTVPPLPWTFKRKNRGFVYTSAYLYEVYRGIRRNVSKLMVRGRKMGGRWQRAG
ncbi:MAG: hypothetical protein FJY92_06785 [Candidatus Hydrogenedentes bacterium]|nr:hypothetical protein [Candidatus Hydrogenedentota bacterium]